MRVCISCVFKHTGARAISDTSEVLGDSRAWTFPIYGQDTKRNLDGVQPF